MTRYKKIKTAFSCFLLLSLLPYFLTAQTSPEDFLGFKAGADRKLADYNQMQAYFKKLDKESPRIKVVNIGTSTRGKPIIMAIITAEENMGKLDTFREIVRKLRDPRTLSPEEARRLSKTGKVILLISCNVHATEIASTQMAMELAYKLATGDTPFDAKKVLNDVIFLLIPTSNPDGQQMVTDWYRKYVGTKYEGGRMPWLYHDYAGHDNNRDWFMFNLSETRAVSKVLYHDWLPQIHLDEHQMGSTGARLFIPPFMDPPVPNVQPLLWRSVNLCGSSMAYDLQKNGFKGVVHGRSYTGWWIGACDDTSWLHNVVGLLSEMASVRVASPIYIDPTEVPQSYYEKRMNFPDPWPGGWWRLRDLVDYELTLSLSLIKTASLHREDFLYNFYKMYKNSIEIREKNEPFAFIIPSKQRDYPTTLRMLDILMYGGVEVHQAKEDFTADSKLYPAGSYVVKMSQPYKPYAQALLEKQKYPNIRQYPGGPPVPPYDNAGWTLPLQMGVTCDRIEHAFETKLEKLEKISSPSISPPKESASYVILDSRMNASYTIAFSLLKNKAEVYRSKEKIKREIFKAAAGSFIVKNTKDVQRALPALLKKWNIKVFEVDNISEIPKNPLKHHRIGLYRSWRSNMDEGWTRYVFDDLEVPYTTMRNKDFTGTEKGKKAKKKKKIDLKAKYDVIVFASESTDIIKMGKPSPTSRYGRYYTEMPPEYEGGIGKEGVEALKAFVEKGGILVTLNDACNLVFKEFKSPARNALEGVARSTFFCPTSLLKIKVDNESPIGYGMPKEAAAMFSRSIALSTRIPSAEWDRKVVASFPEEDLLLSGWLLGEDVITRKAAVVDTRYKKGHIVLIGIRCQFRAQSHGTYKFLLNALLYPEIK
ncbi:MAG: peptidase M14 family protein [Candidatus Aminicenantes bacterium]|nr:peptidase M14 family protein [Candidatus Aminicenantes bacterium]